MSHFFKIVKRCSTLCSHSVYSTGRVYHDPSPPPPRPALLFTADLPYTTRRFGVRDTCGMQIAGQHMDAGHVKEVVKHAA